MKHIEKSTETLTSLMRDNDDTGEHSTEILCKKKISFQGLHSLCRSD